MIKTGAQHIESLKDHRQVYINGSLASDDVTHPSFRRTVQSVGMLYDFQALPDNRELMTFEALESGERANRIWQLPKSYVELVERRRALEAWTERRRLSRTIIGKRSFWSPAILWSAIQDARILCKALGRIPMLVDRPASLTVLSDRRPGACSSSFTTTTSAPRVWFAHNAIPRNRSAFAMTLTDDRAMAAAATIGESVIPQIG
jgi:hypothetical protein